MAPPELALGIDPSTGNTGLAVTSVNRDGETKIIHGCEIQHRTHQISEKMEFRKNHRNGRRHRRRHARQQRRATTAQHQNEP